MRNMSVLSLSFRNKYFKNRTNETRLFLHRIMLDAESRALNLTSKKKTPHLIHSASHSFCLARQREREETQREREREVPDAIHSISPQREREVATHS